MLKVLIGRREASLIKRHQRARVDAAGEERAERHVGHHLADHRLAQAVAQRLDGLGVASTTPSGTDAASQ